MGKKKALKASKGLNFTLNVDTLHSNFGGNCPGILKQIRIPSSEKKVFICKKCYRYITIFDNYFKESGEIHLKDFKNG